MLLMLLILLLLLIKLLLLLVLLLPLLIVHAADAAVVRVAASVLLWQHGVNFSRLLYVGTTDLGPTKQKRYNLAFGSVADVGGDKIRVAMVQQMNDN